MDRFATMLLDQLNNGLRENKLTQSLALAKQAETKQNETKDHCQGCRCFARKKGEGDNREGAFTRSKEEKIRNMLQKLFPVKFAKIRPPWLTNPETGKPLELDCYCSELNIGVEYDGQQHFKFLEHYHKTPEQIEKMKQRDLLKNKLCKDHGVHLIRVRYWIRDDELENYLLAEIGRVL